MPAEIHGRDLPRTMEFEDTTLINLDLVKLGVRLLDHLLPLSHEDMPGHDASRERH
jgi:hypothetical protein